MYLFLNPAKIVKSSAEDKLVIIAAAVTTHESVKAWAKLKEEGKPHTIQVLTSESSISSV